MIYLDNGATSFPKPKQMIEAMSECMSKYCGNPGRSGHYMSMRTGEEVYRARRKVAELFNIDNAERLIFTKNTTESLNMGLKGVLRKGDHVVTTSMEHNSVLRPLKSLEMSGVEHTIVMAGSEGHVMPGSIEKAIRQNTKMIVITAASNVTGTKMPLGEISAVALKKGLVFMVDAAQGAGSMEIDVSALNIDILAFPGHKGLLGPLGTGGLYVAPKLNIRPLTEGGTGTLSKSRLQPCEFPEGFEAGTINAPGIVGLGCSVEFVKRIGVKVISEYEKELITYLDGELKNMEFIKLYGPGPEEKTGISLINIEDFEPEETAALLNDEFGIAVRSGYHCAGLAHKSIGTWKSGAVRISVGPYNTMEDMKKLVDALWNIGKRKN